MKRFFRVLVPSVSEEHPLRLPDDLGHLLQLLGVDVRGLAVHQRRHQVRVDLAGLAVGAAGQVRGVVAEVGDAEAVLVGAAAVRGVPEAHGRLQAGGAAAHLRLAFPVCGIRV